MKFILIILACIYGQTVSAQNYVGDQLNNIYLGKALFKKNTKRYLKDYKEPLLILNLMAINCRYCIAALPKYDSLLPTFSSRAQMIILLRGNKQQNEEFIKEHGFRRYKNLTFLAVSPKLEEQFNRVGNPFHVWLNNQRKIIASTPEEYITAQNIQTLLATQAIPEWPDISLPAAAGLIDESVIDNSTAISFYSFIQGYREGFDLESKFTKDTLRNMQWLAVYNRSLLQLYSLAIKPLVTFDVNPKRFIIGEEAKSWFAKQPAHITETQWKRNTFYCYESVLPLHTKLRARHQKMVQDLNAYFGLNGRLEKRETWCQVLRPATDNKNLSLQKDTAGSRTLKRMAQHMNYYQFPELFIADTSAATQEFICEFSKEEKQDINLLKIKLRQCGIEMTRERRWIEYFVINE